MPIMDVPYAAGSSRQGRPRRLSQRSLTDVLIRMEGGANTPGGRGFAWVFFTAFAGGRLVDRRRGAATMSRRPENSSSISAIPEGYMNYRPQERGPRLGRKAAITEVAGVSEPGRSVLTVIDEVTEGNWGNAGRPISLESIAATVGQSKQGARLAWSRSYFEAKARAMAAAAYPKDAGGLFPFRLTPGSRASSCRAGDSAPRIFPDGETTNVRRHEISRRRRPCRS